MKNTFKQEYNENFLNSGLIWKSTLKQINLTLGIIKFRIAKSVKRMLTLRLTT
jgi:hypothetical protein